VCLCAYFQLKVLRRFWQGNFCESKRRPKNRRNFRSEVWSEGREASSGGQDLVGKTTGHHHLIIDGKSFPRAAIPKMKKTSFWEKAKPKRRLLYSW